MLYVSAEDFYTQVANIKRLSREEEIELAKRMREGDQNAKKVLTDSYLPVLAAYIKRYANTPSLDLVYKGIEVLETSVEAFDFLYESPSPNLTFAYFLSDRVRKTVTRYIAESHSV